MPHIVAEGAPLHQQPAASPASLYLYKALFSTIIAVCFIFLQSSYPFQPIQFTLLNALTVGFPSFVLALEPNRERIHGNFLQNIIKKAIPGALTMVLNILFLEAINFYIGLSLEQVSTVAVIVTGFTMLMILFRVCMPFNAKHVVLFTAMCAAFLFALIFLGTIFHITALTAPMILIIVPLLCAAVSMFAMFLHLIERILMRHVE